MIPEAGLKTPLHRNDWTTMRLKYLLQRKRRNLHPDDGVVTAFRDGVVTLRSNRREDGFTFADKEIGYQGVEPGDLVIHAMDGFAGAIGVSDSRGKCSPVYTITVPRSNAQAHTRFWAYYLRNLAVTGFIESLAKGIRERSTDFRWNDAGNLLVNFPDIETQKVIADFLDRETARIDQLIEKKQRLVGLVDEKRAALITAAVTGQTGPGKSVTRPAKGDGGVKQHRLFPTLPDGWVLSKHGRHFVTRMGETILRENLIDGAPIPVFSATEEDTVFGNVDTATAILLPGDLVIPARGNCIGAVKYINERATSTQTTIQTRCYDSNIHPKFAFYFLRAFRKDLFYFDRTAIPQITVEQVNQNPIILPPYDIQKSIADFLDREAAQLDAVRLKTNESIGKLREYRSALITAAVTGQIDATAWDREGTTDARLDAIEAEMEPGAAELKEARA